MEKLPSYHEAPVTYVISWVVLAMTLFLSVSGGCTPLQGLIFGIGYILLTYFIMLRGK